MNLTIHPGRSIQGIVASHGELSLPGDKSLSHRAAIMSAMAVSDSEIDNFQVSGVTRVMLDALTQLNIPWSLDNQRLSVEGRGLRSWSVPSQPIFCGNSATTIRLLAGALAAGGVPSILDGSAGLRRRPMDRIVDPLAANGRGYSFNRGMCAARATALAHAAKSIGIHAAGCQRPGEDLPVVGCPVCRWGDHLARARTFTGSHRTHAAQSRCAD